MKIFRAFLIASIITLITEVIESKFKLNLNGALLLSIPAFVLGIIIDRIHGKKEFENKISKFVLSLAEIRRKEGADPSSIQEIMCHITKEFADIFDQKIKKSNPKELTISLHCFICNTNHLTDGNMNCTKCGLSSDKWSYLNNLLKNSENQ